MKSLIIKHDSAKLNGSAISFELMDGGIRVRIANQSEKSHAIYDWDHDIMISLDFKEICELIQVFRGECESLRCGGFIRHESNGSTRTIYLSHKIDPICGYLFELTTVDNLTGITANRTFYMTPAEALGVCESLTGVLHYIAFGI